VAITAEQLRKNLGLRFAELRRDLDLTQEELATKKGVTRRYIAAIEAGERNMRLDSLAEWCEFFGVEPAAFFEESETKRAGRGRPSKK
jgi:transcriptional regulator with XRE-family HTH domain